MQFNQLKGEDMNSLKSAALAFLLVLGVIAPAAQAADGLLLVGTQNEVRHMLKGTHVTVKFSEDDANAMVAVRLEGTTVSVYEGCCVDEIIKFVGNVVKGGVCLILTAGCDLCKLLEGLTCTVIEVGKAALEAVVYVLSHATCCIIDGVTFVVQTSFDVLKCVGEFIEQLLHCPKCSF